MGCIAIILAGGSGSRMASEIPKQFINVYDKPVLFYTLEAFERHPQVDSIEVVSLSGWEAIVVSYAKQFNITKLKKIVTGGESIQESIRNGLNGISEFAKADDLVIIHDGIRPLVDEFVLSDVIKTAAEKGNAVSSMPYNEQIFLIDEKDERKTCRYIPRETIRRVSSPQAYHYSQIKGLYDRAFAEGKHISGSSYADTLMADYGEKVYFSVGSDRNIKLISQDDLQMFKAFLVREKSSWIK